MPKDDKGTQVTETAINVNMEEMRKLGRAFVDTMEGTEDEKATRAVTALLAALEAPVLFTLLATIATRTVQKAKRVEVQALYNNGETHVYAETGIERWGVDDDGNAVRLDEPPPRTIN